MPIDADAKAWLLRHAAVLAYPSLDEGFGFPILEAQAAGVPVVASDVGSIAEIAGAGIALVSERSAGAFAAELSAVIGGAVALSSTAIVLPIAGTHSPVGRAALAMLLFEDIMIVPIIFILGAMAPNAAGDGWEGMLTTLWQGGLVIAAMMILGRFALPRLFGQAARTKSPELFRAMGRAPIYTRALRRRPEPVNRPTCSLTAVPPWK